MWAQAKLNRSNLFCLSLLRNGNRILQPKKRSDEVEKEASTSGFTRKEKDSVVVDIDGSVTASASQLVPGKSNSSSVTPPSTIVEKSSDVVETTPVDVNGQNALTVLADVEDEVHAQQRAVCQKHAEKQHADSPKRAVTIENSRILVDNQDVISKDYDDANDADDEEDEVEEVFSEFVPPPFVSNPLSLISPSHGREKLYLNEDGCIDMNSSDLEVIREQTNRWSDGEIVDALFDDEFITVKRKRGRKTKEERLKLQEGLVPRRSPRGIRKDASQRRLKALIKMHLIKLFVLLEPMLENAKIDKIEIVLGFDYAVASDSEYSSIAVQDHGAIDEFNECVDSCDLTELNMAGEEFTWGGTRNTEERGFDNMASQETFLQHIPNVLDDVDHGLLLADLTIDEIKAAIDGLDGNQAIEPLKGILAELEHRCQTFLWQGTDDHSKRH
ncbi:OLC1v1018681C1 [Oldenlandia corymbosa var. corymbosa]|uniref:OLC1v1018681C1 n=1 Tax=Oldenlandia corymbosa var. corymbosa TaxID=529605 RepID=A0AAV1ECB4_OLDCO|nr:OLC1v1018681C1 [Oldenlandia corymbosa var. corymbosa]